MSTLTSPVALGRTNREAADELGLLPDAVNSYLKTAMCQLHASNRVGGSPRPAKPA